MDYRYNNLTHIAPTDGQILRRQAVLGQSLDDGEHILQFLPAMQNELMCEVPLQVFKQSQQLNNVEFSHSKLGLLTLARQSSVLDEKSQTLKVYLDTTTASQTKILVGERMNIDASYSNSALTRVPLDAVELSIDAAYVWAMQPENKVSRMAVEIVETQKDYFLVKSELKVGEYVITIGKQGLQEQQQVKTTNFKPSSVTKRASS